jgi:hypothetical protein
METSARNALTTISSVPGMFGTDNARPTSCTTPNSGAMAMRGR